MMPDKPEKRRGAIDTLIVRDWTAVFWFIISCAVGTACAIYTLLLAEALQKPSKFVVMDTAGAFYVPTGVTFGDDMNKRMHEEMGDIFAETFLTRTSTGLVYQDRMSKLFWKNAKDEAPARTAVDDELDKEANYFKSARVNQTVVIDKTVVTQRSNKEAATSTTGTVTRTSIFKDQQKVHTFRFNLRIRWRQNEDITVNKGFPSQVIEFFKFTLEPITAP